jgi:mRNA-degrading endonuclease RelE of RelBE toxin-antitoxin system
LGNDRLRIAESVEEDWIALSDDERAAVRKAFAAIDDDPIIGAPLLEPLRGLWSYRAGAVRVIYRIVAEARFVVILALGRVT